MLPMSVTHDTENDMPSGLLRRDGRYSIRRRVPVDLIDAYGGRQAIVKALGTSDPQEARELRDEAWAKLTAEFKAMRAELAGADLPATTPAPKKPDLTPTFDIGRAARRVEMERREAFGAGRLKEWVAERQEETRQHEAVLAGALEAWLPFYDHEVRLGALQAALESKWRPSRPDPAPSAPAAPTGAAAQSMTAMVDRWAAEQGPRAKSLRKAYVVVREFDAVTGGTAIGAVTPDHFQSYKEKLIASGVAPATGNNKLNLLRAVIRSALAARIITSDPCAGISIKPGKGGPKARTIYDRDALATLFGSSVWSRDARPVGGRGEAAYWLPLLALYTGARLEELGQLRLIDVGTETYLDADDTDATANVIRLVADETDGLTLKNEGSERRIPIHPELERLGFLRYVATMRDQGETRVFPLLKPDRDGTRTAAWSKWYGRWLRKEAGITDTRVTFHSFRHSFKHYARQSGLAPDVQNEITGHETGDVADQYGGLSYPLLPLVGAMKRYRVPGFEPPAPPPAFR
jgi:integrase